MKTNQFKLNPPMKIAGTKPYFSFVAVLLMSSWLGTHALKARLGWHPTGPVSNLLMDCDKNQFSVSCGASKNQYPEAAAADLDVLMPCQCLPEDRMNLTMTSKQFRDKSLSFAEGCWEAHIYE